METRAIKAHPEDPPIGIFPPISMLISQQVWSLTTGGAHI
jgi:hypothetical protein